MQVITIHNYEAFLLDLVEGNLNEEQQVALELFLIQHPELNNNLQDLSAYIVPVNQEYLPNKLSLKKSPSDLVTEHQLISYIEELCDVTEQQFIEKSCAANPSLSNELRLYKTTISQPDLAITFNDKYILKHQPKIVWFNFSTYQYIAIAASVIFMFGIYILWQQNLSSQLTIPAKQIVVNNSIPKETLNAKPISKPYAQVANSKPTRIAKNKNHISASSPIAPNATHHIQSPTTIALHSDSINNNQPTEETFLAINEAVHESKQPLSIVQTISETDDETEETESLTKNNIWSTVIKTFKNLNQVGVKQINGEEYHQKSQTGFGFTLGNLSVSHKKDL